MYKLSELKTIEENSFYSTQQEKIDFLSDDSNIVSAFLFNFLGILGVINASNSPFLQQYLKKDKKLRINSINDKNNDISLIIKFMNDKKFFMNRATVNEITRFLVKAKSGDITSINSDIVHGWLDRMSPSFVMNMPVELRTVYSKFRKERKPVEWLAFKLKLYAKRFKYSGEFMPIARRTKMKSASLDAEEAKENEEKRVAKENASKKNKIHTMTEADFQYFIDNFIIDGSLRTHDFFKWIYDTFNMGHFDSRLIIKDEKSALLLEICFSFMEDLGESTYVRRKFVTWLKDNYPDNVDNHFAVGRFRILKVLTDPNSDDLRSFENAGLPSFAMKQIYRIIDEKISNEKIVLDYADTNNLFTSGSTHSFINKMYRIPNQVRESIYLYVIDRINDFISKGNMYMAMKLIASDSVKNKSYSGRSISKKIMELGNIKFPSPDKRVQLEDQRFFIDNNDKTIYKFFIPESNSILKSMFSFKYSINQFVHLDGFFKEVEIKPSDALKYKIVLDAIAILENGHRYENRRHLNFLIDLADSFKSYTKNTALIQELVNRIISHKSMDDALHYTMNISFEHATSTEIDRMVRMKKMFPDVFSKYERAVNTVEMVEWLQDYDSSKDVSGQKLSQRVETIFDRESYSSSMDFVRKIKNEKPNILSGDKKRELISGLLCNWMMKKDFRATNTAFNTMFYSYSQGGTIKFSKEENAKIIKCMISSGLLQRAYADFHTVELTGRGSKNNREMFISTLSEIIFDLAETESKLLDKFFDIVDDPYVVRKLRESLIGAKTLATIVETGEVRSFQKINEEHMKKILKYNSIDMGEILKNSNINTRKKKNEKFGSYFSRVNDKMKDLDTDNLLGKLQVVDKELTETELDGEAISLIQKYHSKGRHGNFYFHVRKVFDVHLPSDEFEAFKLIAAQNEGWDKEIRPAFHGSGGIAASMILRYGFTVIPSNASGVAGRMLGDGIYFSPVVDKVAQYVNNHGHSRRYGDQGYIFEMRNTLGPLDYANYNSPTNHGDVGHSKAGVSGNDGIQSAEYVVRNHSKQLKIIRAYEVELTSESRYRKMRDDYMNTITNVDSETDVDENTDMMRFSKHRMLNEDIQEKYADTSKNLTKIIIANGIIPIIDDEDGVEYVMFDNDEKVVLPHGVFLDFGPRGVEICFRGTDEDMAIEVFDGSNMHMNSPEEFEIYKSLWKKYETLNNTV